MKINGIGKKAFLSTCAAVLCIFIFCTEGFCSNIAEITAIGRVESIYRERVTMRILEIISSGTLDVGLATGSWVSFDLPKKHKSTRGLNVKYGSVIEAALIGNVITEYAVGPGTHTGKAAEAAAEAESEAAESETEKAEAEGKAAESEAETAAESEEADDNNALEGEPKTTPTVLLWTAQSVRRVKNQRKYSENKKDKKSDKKKKKEKPPLKIYTQKETIRGNVRLNRDKVYIKEDRMRRKDRGLLVISEDWLERLRGLSGQRVVVHGTSHRTSISSGTVEIENILKVYPK